MFTNTFAIIITSAWPSKDGGSGFAVNSLVNECLLSFSKVFVIGLTDSAPDLSQSAYQHIQYAHIKIKRYPVFVRFILSLGGELPAVCQQFKSKNIIKKVLQTINQFANGNKCVVIVEDLPLAIVFSKPVRKRFPEIIVVIRSENVLSKVFEPLTKQYNIFKRYAWSIEVAKIRQAEIATCKEVDRIWAISSSDEQTYLNELGITCDGVFGVSLDRKYYNDILSGDSKTVVFVGGIDLRKRLGIVNFITRAWPLIRAQVPDAQFVLAGRASETFNDPINGIHGLGYISDDRHIWEKGRIALNPQEIGSGIKLKSIISMLAAKALVSTEIGIEGIAGENGTHFLIASDAQSLAPLVIHLMKNPLQAEQMGQIAKEWAQEEYSQERLRQFVLPLLKDVVEISHYIQAKPTHR